MGPEPHAKCSFDTKTLDYNLPTWSKVAKKATKCSQREGNRNCVLLGNEEPEAEACQGERAA